MLWHVLGPIEVRAGGDWAAVGAPKWRAVLAALLAARGGVVATGDLVDELWGEHPAPGARKLVSGYVLRLRRLIGDPSGQVLVTQAPGYRLAVGRADLDACCFEDLLAAGRRALEREDAARAGDLLTQALGLWRGPALADVPRGPLAAAEADLLDELRLDAVELRIEAWIGSGRTAHLVADLRGLTSKYPLRERSWHQLMRVLESSGRTAEALAAYATARKVIRDELGVDPGPDLQRLHRHLLDRDVKAAAGGAGPMAVPRPRRILVAPRQLPTAVQHFTGRRPGLAALWQAARADSAAVVIAAIDGAPGIGKTALAVHWAHQAAADFPDGQLYVNLRGFDPSGQVMQAGTAIRGFLDAFQIPAERIPASQESQAALYRSVLAGKRVLVVLDNARDAGQVRPLLPGSPGCLVVVTSRARLTGLAAAEGARLITLDVLPASEAGELLASRIGASRTQGEPGAVDELAQLCGQLPLALSVVAARTVARPRMSLAAAAAELAGAVGRLRVLETGDPVTNVRTVFSWSYQSLEDLPARMFRLLSVHPGPDITVPAVAALMEVTLADAGDALGTLVMANLVEEHLPGRFALHDLLRAYAAERAVDQDTEAERHAALQRALDYYLYTGHAAAVLLEPHRDPLRLPPLRPGAEPEVIADDRQAMAWFGAEHRVLAAVIHLSVSLGFDSYAWQLPAVTATFYERQGTWNDHAVAQNIALAAAQRAGDKTGQATAHNYLGSVSIERGSDDQARWHAQQAQELFTQVGSRTGEARAHLVMGNALDNQVRHGEALGHAERALELYRAEGHRGGQAVALNAVGWAQGQLGHYQQALISLSQALDLFGALGHRPGEAATRDSLGYIHSRLGHHAEAGHCYIGAVELHAGLGDVWNQASALASLGHARSAAGQTQAALDAWREAVEILNSLQDPGAEKLRAEIENAQSPLGDGRMSVSCPRTSRTS